MHPSHIRTVLARLILAAILLLAVLLLAGRFTVQAGLAPATPVYLPVVLGGVQPIPPAGEFILLGWNDLGMHCYNRDFRDLAVLPPFNTLWAQVIRRGDPPIIVASGIEVSYAFPDNTYSVGKSNFWSYEKQLFGVDLPDNVGLKGKGLSGEMDLHGEAFTAEGIPLTEFSDSNLVKAEPYQLAVITAKDLNGKLLASNQVVSPVSTEMHCDTCHHDYGVEDIATGRVETNILTLHDEENAGEYPSGHEGKLMDRRPILCAECHASNALGAPGADGLPNLSKAMHEKHAGKVPDTLAGCYNCHPGPSTKCLRDVMSGEFGMDCIDCHGSMEKVKENPAPWLNEPRCDSCHDDIEQDQVLYRMSKGHAGIYCAACHDSPHAIAPSTQPKDGLKFIHLQGHAGPLEECTTCHLTNPGGEIH